MSAELLLREFDRVTDEREAVTRLRQFVLEAAVRGLLVAQDSRDGDAAAWLAEAALPDDSLSRRAVLSTEFPSPDEVPFDLPSGWLWCRLSQVGVVVGGGTPPSGDAANFTAGGGGISWFTPADMARQASLEVDHGARDLTDKGFAASSATRMPTGTVLFTSRAPIGYVGIAKGSVTTNQGFKSLVPSTAVESGYVAVYFRAFGPSIDANAPGTTFREVSGKIVSRLCFPLPPLPEQRRIVAKVEELMSLCDQLAVAQENRDTQRDALRVASLHRLTVSDVDDETQTAARFFLDAAARLITNPRHLDSVRQALLALAVAGRLVPQDPGDEPAHIMLDRVRQQKLSKGIETGRDWVGKGPVPLPSQFVLPTGWAVARIGSAVQRVTVGYVGPMTSQYSEGGVPFLRSQNVRADRFRWEGLIAIRPDFHRTILKSSLAPGDVVIVRSGNVGTACVIPDELSEANCSDLVIAKNPLALHPRFLSFFMNSLASAHIEAGSVGMALTHFNTKSVATMPIPIPPLAEQARIVAKPDELMSLCDELQAVLASARVERSRLLQSLLHEALNGASGDDALVKAF